MDETFSDMKRFEGELKRLSDDRRVREKIDILFNAIGLLVSGGTANVVRQAAGNVIGLIGTINGLQTRESRFRTILRQIGNKAFEFERLRDKRKYFLGKIEEIYDEYNDLECLPTVARRF